MKINENLAISDNGFVFNPSSGESFSLNESGRKLLKMIKEEKSDEEIQNLFLADYDTDRNTFSKDFQDFKEMLQQYQLLK